MLAYPMQYSLNLMTEFRVSQSLIEQFCVSFPGSNLIDEDIILSSFPVCFRKNHFYRGEKMKAIVNLLVIFSVWIAGSIGIQAEVQSLRLERDERGVSVYVGEKLFTKYLTLDDWKYPYFYPVNGPLTGESVTTESSEPYPHHHSLFFGCDRVNGGNYWQEGLERGRIVSQKIDLKKAKGNQVVFTDECLWQREGAEPPFQDTRVITVQAPGEDLRYIDFEITLTALMDVRIEKTNHSLFAARMVPDLSVPSGGILVNAEGMKGEKGTFGQPSPWCDFSGAREGKSEGLAILTHPDDPLQPIPWFTRDYGFFSPTPFNWLAEPYEIKKGDTLKLKYRVVVHAGDADQANIASLYEEWARE